MTGGGAVVVIVPAVVLVVLNLYALVMVLGRARLFHVPLYRPMVLKIGLSVLPVLVAVAIPVAALVVGEVVLRTGSVSEVTRIALLVGTGVAAVVWLLLFPNSVYLITELNYSHRRADDPVPLWFDIIGTLTLSMSGVMNGIASLAVIQLLVEALTGPDRTGQFASAGSWVFALAAIVLGSFGVYLGRYIRVNSWDVQHPLGLLRKIASHFRTRENLVTGSLFIASYSVFFFLLYALVTVPLRAALV